MPGAPRCGRWLYRGSALLGTIALNAFTDGEGAVAEHAAVEGENLVYRAVDEAGNTIYVGITKNPVSRAAAHLREKGIVIDPIPGLANLSKQEAKAVEQTLIDHHGLGKNGGTLLNKLNSIAHSNPIYKGAASLGAKILSTAHYPGF